MTVVFLIFILFCLLTARYKNPFSKNYNETWLDRESTVMVNGIFTLLVFMSHFSGYVVSFFKIDSIYLGVNRFLGQCVVCSFLFYSGYGIAEQIKKGKNVYLHKLITKRLSSLWIKFAICVLCYVMLQYAFGNCYKARDFVLSFFGLYSLGNSAWYVFYTLFAYVAIFVSFRFTTKNSFALLLISLLTACYIGIFFSLFKDKSAYYLTAFVLPAGMAFSFWKERFFARIQKHFISLFCTAIALYAGSFILRHSLRLGGWAYNLTAVSFSFVLVFLTFKIHFQNKILCFLGNYVFEIYMLQRLPMIAFKPLANSSGGGVQQYRYLLYLAICVAITMLLAVLFKILFKKMKI